MGNLNDQIIEENEKLVIKERNQSFLKIILIHP